MSNLTFYDRQRIEYYLVCKEYSKRRIASLIGRDHTVVVREVKRNTSKYHPYSAELAQRIADRKKHITNKCKLYKDEKLKDYVKAMLKVGWSPEQIAGRLKNKPPDDLIGKYINYESIYQYIYDKEPYLYHHLRNKHYSRRKKCHRTHQSKKVIIPDRTSISERNININNRTSFGHWESDTMFGKDKSAVSVQVERKSRYISFNKIEDLKSDTTIDAITQTIESIPIYNAVLSITFDNGFENTKHTQLKGQYNLQTYFCDSYSSWQKGSVENANKQLREFLTRKTNFNTLTYKQLKDIQNTLNNRPRKILNFSTSNEIMNEELSKLKAQVVH